MGTMVSLNTDITPRYCPSRDEAVLIERILSGETELFQELVAPYQRGMQQIAYQVLEDIEDAKECAQEALLKAFAHLKSFRAESKFSTWLIQIAGNEARMRRRNYRRALYESLDEPVRDVGGEEFAREVVDVRELPGAELERNLLQQAIVRALTKLAPLYQEVFELRDVQQLSIAETAKLLGITEASVKTRLLRARLQMRELLEPAWGAHWQSCCESLAKTKLEIM